MTHKILTLLFLAVPLTAADPVPTRADLDKAVKAHAEAKTWAREDFITAMKKRIRADTRGASRELTGELKTFEARGVLPIVPAFRSEVADYRVSLAAADSTLTRLFDRAVAAASPQGAKKLRTELAALLE